MTLGQKLKLLLKDNNMTQQDLAERLDVSRQAVGKWVNDRGIPEVGKLVEISNLFGVSIDYLLKEDFEEKVVSKECDTASNGYYVSQEMLEGYLLYNKQRVKQIVGGISLFILSNVFDSFGYHNKITYILYWLTMIGGIILIIWYFLQIKQYQQMKNEHLIFDDNVLEEFKKQREKRRKKYTIIMIVGVIILLLSSEMEYLLLDYFGDVFYDVFEWLASTVWLALIIGAGFSMHIDSNIINNTEPIPQNSKMKQYSWVYVALPVTAIAVLIGAITNVWSPYAPIIILFCCLLVTTCKLFIESREKNE